MSAFDFNALGDSLNQASLKTKETGVSFAGKSLKLNNENDAKEVMEAIENCEDLEFLDLEGNTLGPDAAKSISKVIEKHGRNLKRALWKDMFTGRMKDEIPVALKYLGQGLCAAQTRLVELDLSDNAFGPIGVQGLASLLSSSSCFTLQELRLNNNGLGISGGKLLAKALLLCNAESKKETSKPLGLRVFVAGRNRLENEGASALASVFKVLKSLEEVVMPQNGIYHKGISALAAGLSENTNLRILNLNDNTVGLKGAKALAQVLHNFPYLEQLNLGDCLLKTSGAIVLAESLDATRSHSLLMELDLSSNEIGVRGANAIAKAMADKTRLVSLVLEGNYFQEEGKKILLETFKGRFDSLQMFGCDEDEDDENDDDDDDDEDDDDHDDDEDDENDDVDEDEEEDEDEDEEEEEDTENEEGSSETDDDQDNDESLNTIKNTKTLSVQEFLEIPTEENFMLLQGDKMQAFLDHVESISKIESEEQVNNIVKVIMKVSALCKTNFMDVQHLVEQVTERLYLELFTFAVKTNQISTLNNALLVNLSLLKSEDKNASKIDWNLEGCFKALEKVCHKDYFPPQTKDTLKAFIEKPISSRFRLVDPFQEARSSLKKALYIMHGP